MSFHALRESLLNYQRRSSKNKSVCLILFLTTVTDDPVLFSIINSVVNSPGSSSHRVQSSRWEFAFDARIVSIRSHIIPPGFDPSFHTSSVAFDHFESVSLPLKTHKMSPGHSSWRLMDIFGTIAKSLLTIINGRGILWWSLLFKSKTLSPQFYPTSDWFLNFFLV